MSKDKKEPKPEGMFVECEVVHDGLGITHFLPLVKRKNCND
jgi:hypothetical protein